MPAITRKKANARRISRMCRCTVAAAGRSGASSGSTTRGPRAMRWPTPKTSASPLACPPPLGGSHILASSVAGPADHPSGHSDAFRSCSRRKRRRHRSRRGLSEPSLRSGGRASPDAPLVLGSSARAALCRASRNLCGPLRVSGLAFAASPPSGEAPPRMRPEHSRGAPGAP
jgi:hypothetical protein